MTTSMDSHHDSPVEDENSISDSCSNMSGLLDSIGSSGTNDDGEDVELGTTEDEKNVSTAANGINNRKGCDDPHKPGPSPVVHVRNLYEAAVEADLVHAIKHFGTISYVIMMPKRKQALVEFEDIESAKACVNYAATSPVYVCNQIAHVNFSTSQKIKRPGGDDSRVLNHILLFTILNPTYPITVDVMHTICSPYGDVQRIVIFKKNGVQCMVEYENIACASRAKESLNGADIYSGCCTLKIEYAKPSRLNVNRNDPDYSWDYTNPHLGGLQERGGPPPRNAPLLQNPRYNSGPTPYSSESHSMGSGGHGNYADAGICFGNGDQGNDTHSMGGGSNYGDHHGHSSMGSGGGYNMYEDNYGGYGGPPRGQYDMPHDRGYGGSKPMHQPMQQDRPGYGRPHSNPGYGHDSSMIPPAGGIQQGAVLMVYGLNMDKVNAEKLFNLFCLYGNVVRIKFLKSKEGSAMVQLGDGISVERAIQHLNNSFLFGSKLQLGPSKQAFLQDVPNPHDLSDGTCSFKDFMGNRNNRFTNPESASKNRIQSPTKILHYFNAPPNMNDDDLERLFESVGAPKPAKVKQFPSKSDRSSTGLIEFGSKSDAAEALVLTNHANIPNPTGKNPYIFKLCFSATPILFNQ